MVRTAVRRTSPRNRSAMPGEASFASRWAECHSSVSGTSLRIQKTSRAGSTPTRKTTRGLQPASRKVVHEASKMPMLTPLWSTAAIQGRQRRGQVSDSNEAPTAHSPPMPTAARNRTTSSCHHVCAEEGQAGEQGVGEDGQAQRPAPADAVADATEETTPNRPADQECGLDPGAVPADVLIPCVGDADQLRDEGGRDQDVKVHVQAVAQPAEPGGDTRLPLVRREVARLWISLWDGALGPSRDMGSPARG